MKNEQWHLTPVFEAIHNATEKVIILQGGTSSSKTYSAMQSNILYCIYNPNHIVTVTGESIPNLKKGAYRDAETIYANSPWFQSMVSQWNKTDRTIEFKNGAKMEFISNLDEQSAKAGKRDRLFVDEANGIPWGIFFQLAIRTKGQIMIAYNPSAPFWAHDKLIGTTPEGNDLSATVKFLRSWHEHNTALSEDEHRKIEGIKDPDLFRVYARGLTGNLVGLIYPNWKMIPDKDFPWKEDGKFGGLDFGYTNDPSAGVLCVRIANKIFVHELCYTTAMTPNQIKALFTATGFTQDTPIYCEHDGDMIRQLRQLELLAIPAKKGQGSIKAGISKVNEYEIYYTESSKNLDFERKRYMWLVNPDDGKPTNTPIDKDNHILDAIRYGVYSHFYRAE
jgi:phage terminase large subunit